MAGVSAHTQKACTDCAHLGFVPVSGRLVFCVCVLLIAACVLWIWMWAVKGIKFEES